MFKELNGDPIAKMHYVGFFCVDNNKDVNSAIFQIMYLLSQRPIQCI
jgi:hypothetical protein